MNVTLVFDATSLAWVQEFHARLSAFADAVEQPVDLADLIRNIASGPAAFTFETLRTFGTSDCRIVLKPSEALLHLMTTLRAFNGDIEFIDDAPKIAG